MLQLIKMKKLLSIIVLGLLWCNAGAADSSWLKFPLDNNETMNFNIKDAIETGPNQYKIDTVLTKDSKKIEYQKMAIEKLTKYCGKKSGKYEVPEEMLTEGKTTMPGEISVVGGPGEKGGVVLFKIPYRKFEGTHAIYCATTMQSKEPMRNRYTPGNEKEIINNNIRLLYQEMIMIEYQDCRRKMRGAEIGGEIHWFPINPGSNGDIWNKEICNRLDK